LLEKFIQEKWTMRRGRVPGTGWWPEARCLARADGWRGAGYFPFSLSCFHIPEIIQRAPAGDCWSDRSCPQGFPWCESTAESVSRLGLTWASLLHRQLGLPARILHQGSSVGHAAGRASKLTTRHRAWEAGSLCRPGSRSGSHGDRGRSCPRLPRNQPARLLGSNKILKQLSVFPGAIYWLHNRCSTIHVFPNERLVVEARFAWTCYKSFSVWPFQQEVSVRAVLG